MEVLGRMALIGCFFVVVEVICTTSGGRLCIFGFISFESAGVSFITRKWVLARAIKTIIG
jgi:hypothetical protein